MSKSLAGTLHHARNQTTQGTEIGTAGEAGE